MQPLERVQQVAVLKCLFELVCYTKRYQQPEFELPLWQVYPKQNLRLLLETALSLSAQANEASVSACVQISRLLLQHHASAKAAQATAGALALISADIQYWLQRGLQLGLQAKQLEALEHLAEVVFAKTHAELNLPLLADWLKSYQRTLPCAALHYLQAQLLERQNQLEKALQSYDKAAKAGHLASIKRLLEYWGSRDHQQLQHYLQLGLRHNEPQAMLVNMALLLVDASKATAPHTDAWLKNLKGQLVKARGMGLAGLGYIEGMCHHLGVLGFAKDDAQAATCLLANFHKVPAYCKAALNTFYVLFGAEQFDSALKVAPKALAQLDDTTQRDTLAELEFDIALCLLQLHEQKKPVAFFRTPRELLHSAAKRGYAKANLFINSSAQQRLLNGYRAGRRSHLGGSHAGSSQSIGMPAWATTLAKRGAQVSTVAQRC
jgi:tetratricopeptide (TPR) repeat protein